MNGLIPLIKLQLNPAGEIDRNVIALDMNPIEKAYSKLKAFLRKIAERTVSGLTDALDACAEIFKPAECANYFRACGYNTD